MPCLCRVIHMQSAVVALRLAADTEGAAGEGRLDACLARLAHVLDPDTAATTSSTSGRLQSLEVLTGALQAATLAASTVESAGAGDAADSMEVDVDAAAAVAGTEASAEGMEDPLGAELSAALQAIASLLHLDAATPTAAALAAAVVQRVEELVGRLPAAFFEPLLPPGSLGEEQVCESVCCGGKGGIFCVWRAHWLCTRRPRAGFVACRVPPTVPPYCIAPSYRPSAVPPHRPAAGQAGRGGRVAAL